MNPALNNYSATQHRADLVREARRHRSRPATLELDVERDTPRRRLLWRLRLAFV